MGFFSDVGSMLQLPGTKNDPFFGGAASVANKESMQATLAEWDRAYEENIDKFEGARGRLEPWVGAETMALNAYMGELGLSEDPVSGEAYKNTPGYQNMMASSRLAAENTAGMTGGNAYGDRRIAAAAEPSADMSNQYYNNYMNALSTMASPTTSTNVSSLGLNQAATLGTIGGGVYGANTRNAMQSSEARNQQVRQMVGGAANLYGESM